MWLNFKISELKEKRIQLVIRDRGAHIKNVKESNWSKETQTSSKSKACQKEMKKNERKNFKTSISGVRKD